ncbi:MAG: hypothetical protein KatS3mg051_1680 [Anaerolineae bacterium]|nr:MAG: hypothetical protein KatS3mg051_1680 [Anaerolineae bacterium]
MANVSRNRQDNDRPQTLEELLEKGRRTRRLNESEVLALFDDPDSDEVQAVFDQLEEMGVEILVDEGDALDLDADEGSDVDLADLDEHELDGISHDVDLARLETSILADDPVRMYLKEIGQVQLLDPDRETWLSSQIAACTLLTQRAPAASPGRRTSRRAGGALCAPARKLGEDGGHPGGACYRAARH